MKISDIINNYKEEKLYNIIDIKENFKIYFNMSLEELENYFNNYFIIEKEELISYIKMQYQGCMHLDEIINNRTLEYDYYSKVLQILSVKANAYLTIIKYLCNCKEKNSSYEEILEELQIYHYSSIVTGNDVNRLLIVLFHLLNKFSQALEEINQKKNFLSTRISTGILKCDQEEMYPSEKLIIIDDYSLDKTSLNIKRRTR